MFRLWHSSPIWSAWAMMRSQIDRAAQLQRRVKAGPSVEAIQRSRSAPRRRTPRSGAPCPSPSLSVANARLPLGAFSTTTTGMLGERMPAIGPTAP